jgi:hypothetical protein
MWNKKKDLDMPPQSEGSAPVEVIPSMSALTQQRLKLICAELLNNMFITTKRSKLIGWTMQAFGVSHECAIELIDFTFETMKADVEFELKNELVLAFARRQDLYDRALALGDVRTALEIQKDRDRLRGLYEENSSEREKHQLIFVLGDIEAHANKVLQQEELLQLTQNDSTIDVEPEPYDQDAEAQWEVED